MMTRAQFEATMADSPLVETAHVVLAAFKGETPISRLLRSLIDETALRGVLRERGVKVMR